MIARVCGHLTLDTAQEVYFYGPEFYVLSNFSAFKLYWQGIVFDTSEAAYQWSKFPGHDGVRQLIIGAVSAHDAYKQAQLHKQFQRADWDEIKLHVMRGILLAKVEQHEYVFRKLIETGDRELVEDSWRDSFWGWGPDRQGRNELGKLWMEIRKRMRAKHMLGAPSRSFDPAGQADGEQR